MAYTKYSLTPADNNAAPPNGAPEGMLPSAVNDTMRDMMAQIRDVGDGIRGGTYTMTAPVITGGSVSGITDLAIADGGTGASTFTANSVVLGNGTSALNGNMVAPGTSGNVLVSNGTTWTSASIAASGIKLGLGITGEVWNNVTGSRSSGTTYTNSNTYPISICISTPNGTSQSVNITVGGVVVSQQLGGGSGYTQGVMGTAIVPAGATYVVTFTANGGPILWTELY
jgi:hypothetical protein